MLRVIRKIMLVILGLAGIGAGILFIRRKQRNRWMDNVDEDYEYGCGW